MIVEGIGASAAQHAAAHEEHEAGAPSAGVSAIDASSAICIGHGASSLVCDICIGIIAQPKPETANTVRIGKASNSRKTMNRFIRAD